MKNNNKMCISCGISKGKCVPREFSRHAWQMLLAWGEVNQEDLSQPICEECYWELREVLIDRASEIESTIFDNNVGSGDKQKLAG